MSLDPKTERFALITKLILTGFFLVLYTSVSLALLSSPKERGTGYHENDLYFQADSEYLAKRVAKNQHNYQRVRFHPLFVLFFNPIGRGMNVVTQNPEVTACILNAIAGSVGIFLFFVLFHDALGIPLARSTLYTLIGGLTATHFVFSVVPDTFIFSSVGLILLLIIALRYASSLGAWLGVSVYLTGITITNVASAFIAAYYFLLQRNNSSKINRNLIYRYLGQFVLVSAVLSVAQKILYNVWLFTDRHIIVKEDLGWYLFLPHSFAEGWERTSLMLKHVFLFSIVPPRLKTTIHYLNSKLTMATFMDTAWWDFPVASWVAIFLWITLLGIAAFYLFRLRLYRHRLVKVSLGALLFNLALHSVYGDDFMLFSCGWLVFLLVLVFFSLEQSPVVRKYARLYQLGLLIFVLSMGVATGWLAYDMYHILLSQ